MVSPNCYRLTDSVLLQAASMYNLNQINLNNPFDISFYVNFGCHDANGADGLAFILQNSTSGVTALGGLGAGMGYCNTPTITPSLAIEYDNNQNSFEGFPDPAYDHLAIIKNGDLFTNQAGPVQISATNANVEDCGCHTSRIQWTPTLNRLRVYFDGSLRMTYFNNIITNYFGGNPNVYWGFGAGTGIYYNIQTISFDFANAGTDFSVCQNASAQMNGTGGNSYVWSPSIGLSSSTIANPTVTPTANTTYTLTTINSTGCSDTATVKVTLAPMPTLNAGSDKAICPGGSVILTGVGTGNSYLWTPSTGLSSNTTISTTASPISTTTYTLIATTALGCTAGDAVVVTVYPAVTADGGTAQSACLGGSVQLNASGGISYLWSPTTGLSNSTINNPLATVTVNTTYTVTVVNDLGCSGTDTVSIHVLPAAVANAGSDVSVCHNSAIQLNASGGVQYSWSPSTGLSSSTVSNPFCIGGVTTTYTVTVHNAAGCSASDQIIVTVFPSPNPPDIIPVQPTICAGASVTITASGSVNYSWYPSTGLSLTFGATVVASPTITTNYTVAGSDINGCVSSRFFTVIVNNNPSIVSTTVTDAGCPGTGAINIGLSAGTVNSFAWSNGATTEDINSLSAGSYTVTVTSNGCVVVNSISVGQAPLDKPTNLVVNNITSCGARLNWSAVANMSYYKVRFRQGGTTVWSAAVNAGASLYYDFTGLNAGTTYQFQVSAYCPNNATGGWVTKQGLTKTCTTPVSIAVSIISANSAIVSWTALCSANSYQLIYRKVGTAQWQQSNTTLTTVTLTNLIASTTYEYKIKAVCIGGASAYSVLQNFTTPAIRSEDAGAADFNLNVFPNPTTGIFNVELKTSSNAYSIMLTNVLGEIVWRNENNSTTDIQIDLGNEAASGIYFLIYRDENRVETKRVILER